MKNIIQLLLIFSALVFLSSQTTDRYYPSVQFPYQGGPLIVSVRDTDQVEVSYIYFDKSTNKMVIKGQLDVGLRKLTEVYEGTIVPAQELNYAAGRVRQYLNNNGTVRRRDSLTWAIRYYDSVKTKWGIIQ